MHSVPTKASLKPNADTLRLEKDNLINYFWLPSFE